jgi:hypothetical protein
MRMCFESTERVLACDAAENPRLVLLEVTPVSREGDSPDLNQK